MSTLESPLEALAFNYLSFGLFTVVNNIWTWVAVVTAAFSFWRIKTSSALLKPATVRSSDTSPSPPLTVFVPSSEHSERVPGNNVPASTSTTVTSSSPRHVLDKEGGTKGRFTAYFETDNILAQCVDQHNIEDKKYTYEFKILSKRIKNAAFSSNDIEEEEKLCEKWYQRWEKVIRMRNGEMGWYDYQDLIVIDGNVVRLWEGCRWRRKAETNALFLGGVVRTW